MRQITGPAEKDRACMKALLIPEARMTVGSLGADGAPTYTLQTLNEWIARVKARGHVMLEEKQLKFHMERYSNSAHLWSSYALYSAASKSHAASTAFNLSAGYRWLDVALSIAISNGAAR